MKLFLSILCVFLSWFSISAQGKRVLKEETYAQRLQNKAKHVADFVKNKKYNQKIAFLIDFHKPVGKFRFYIYDLQDKKILEQGLVLHGEGSEVKGKDGLVFSNTENSLQSSLGKCAIGKSYYGQFGKAYKLKGLDKTNSNTEKRYIVLHAFSCVPDEETDKKLCLSWGCPTLSPAFFNKVASYIDNSNLPIIIYSFYE
ncbi:MAG: murein L,D-transpeptidase catalytic domain family protein [Capnocytophaga sp.]|nr:murein L,D-transpeptidase catalytic domain family protein [Capnocytophaga sp.]